MAALVASSTVLLVAACTSTGPVDRSIDAPERAGDVIVRGTLVAPDQRPVEGRPVSASRVKTGGDLVGDLFLTVFSAGLATLGCLGADGPIETCRNGDFTTQTTAGGAFAFRLRANDVRASGGSTRALDISSGIAPSRSERSGPIVSVRITPGEAKAVELGRLALWDGHVRAHPTEDANTMLLDWDQPPGSGQLASTLSDPQRGLLLQTERASKQTPLDARLLEDVAATLTVTARGRISGHSAIWTSAGTPVIASAGAPPSRDAACSLRLGGAAPAPSSQGCWLNDGQFAAGPRVARATSCRKAPDQAGLPGVTCVRAPITEATLDLGVDIPLALVVLRPATDGPAVPTAGVAYVVDVSEDGTTWHRIGESHGTTSLSNPVELDPPDGSKARYVRLRPDAEPMPQPSYDDPEATAHSDPAASVSDYRGDLAGLAEVSVWKGRPRQVHKGGNDEGVRGSGGKTRGIALAIAAALAVLVVAALAYALGRRRGRTA